MAVGSDRYLTPDIYICKDKYQPRGICYGTVCSSKGISSINKTVTETVSMYINGEKIGDVTSVTSRQLKINVNLSPESGTEQRMTAYIMPQDSSDECMLGYPPCRDIDADSKVKWYTSGDFIIAELPLAEHCAVTGFKTVYSSDQTRLDTPSSIGEADGERVTLTFDDGGKTLHRTSMSEKYLIPGEQAEVSYSLRGVEGYYHLAVIDFQTQIFTSAIFLGCGLTKRQRVYNNPARPELGYTYKHLPYTGGVGESIQTDWCYEEDYRICVSYRGGEYWIKSTDHTPYSIGDRVFIMKDSSDLPLRTDSADSGDVSDKLSEYDDIAVPEYFYHGVS